MRLLQFCVCIGLLCFTPFASWAQEWPPVWEKVDQNLIFSGHPEDWVLQNLTEGKEATTYEWESTSGDRLSLSYRIASPETFGVVYARTAREFDNNLALKKHFAVTLEKMFVSVFVDSALHKDALHIFYGTPNDVCVIKYYFADHAEERYLAQNDTLGHVARSHQYREWAKCDNVIRGRWASVIHEYARITSNYDAVEAVGVYEELLEASPQSYALHMAYATLVADEKIAEQSARLVLENAEDAALLEQAATLLDASKPDVDAYPFLSREDRGLHVVLVPLAPYNPWIVEEMALKYEEMTSLPVIIRRLPTPWEPPAPSRSPSRPLLERWAYRYWAFGKDIKAWSLELLMSRVLEKAKEKGGLEYESVKTMYARLEKGGLQWDAIPMMRSFSQAVAPYFASDAHTMVVGLTQLDIYSDDANFIFSIHGGLRNCPVSILSTARMEAAMTNEPPSRERLTDRAAKELVPASLKKLDIPRSNDPFCPYSYANGLQRVDQKKMALSAEVRKRIDAVKTNFIK